MAKKSMKELRSASRQEITKKDKDARSRGGDTGQETCWSSAVEAWGAPRIGVSDGGEMRAFLT